jgi:hypothetical protein
MNGNIRHHSFFGDACVTLARNVRDLLRLAERPFTRKNTREIITTLPMDNSQLAEGHPWHEWAFNRTMKAVAERYFDKPESARVGEPGSYFIAFASRDPRDQDLLIAAFKGVLSQEWEG